jgi:hypothetical protein
MSGEPRLVLPGSGKIGETVEPIGSVGPEVDAGVEEWAFVSSTSLSKDSPLLLEELSNESLEFIGLFEISSFEPKRSSGVIPSKIIGD